MERQGGAGQAEAAAHAKTPRWEHAWHWRAAGQRVREENETAQGARGMDGQGSVSGPGRCHRIQTKATISSKGLRGRCDLVQRLLLLCVKSGGLVCADRAKGGNEDVAEVSVSEVPVRPEAGTVEARRSDVVLMPPAVRTDRTWV